MSLPCYSFPQDEGSPARSVFLSRYSRARCNISSKVLAIAHATMTLLLVAPLRLSLKDKRKENIPLQAVVSEDEQVRIRTQISNLLHAKGHCCIPPSHAGLPKTQCGLPGSEGEISRAARCSSSNSLHPNPLHWPPAPQPFSGTLHPDAEAPFRLKTSRLPVKVCSETS